MDWNDFLLERLGIRGMFVVVIVVGVVDVGGGVSDCCCDGEIIQHARLTFWRGVEAFGKKVENAEATPPHHQTSLSCLPYFHHITSNPSRFTCIMLHVCAPGSFQLSTHMAWSSHHHMARLSDTPDCPCHRQKVYCLDLEQINHFFDRTNRVVSFRWVTVLYSTLVLNSRRP